MPYCQPGDKPTIKYKFEGKSEKIYKSIYSPIEITVRSVPINSTNNYRESGFYITWTANQDPVSNGFYNYYALDYDLITWNNLLWISVRRCGFLDFQQIDVSGIGISRPKFYQNNNDFRLYRQMQANTLQIDYTKGCGNTAPKKYSIEISYNGLILHQDQGSTPITFDVKCGNCPPNTEEHKIDVYPGYCCFDCNSLISEIRAITNTIRRL